MDPNSFSIFFVVFVEWWLFELTVKARKITELVNKNIDNLFSSFKNQNLFLLCWLWELFVASSVGHLTINVSILHQKTDLVQEKMFLREFDSMWENQCTSCSHHLNCALTLVFLLFMKFFKFLCEEDVETRILLSFLRRVLWFSTSTRVDEPKINFWSSGVLLCLSFG